MITEFKDDEGETCRVTAHFGSLHDLLRTLQAEQEDPFLKKCGFPESPELLAAAIWVADELGRKAADISNALLNIREDAHNLQFSQDNHGAPRAITETPRPIPENHSPVYYWHDGYWITDREQAELLDKVGAFGSTHGTAYFPADLPPEQIDKEVLLLVQPVGQATT